MLARDYALNCCLTVVVPVQRVNFRCWSRGKATGEYEGIRIICDEGSGGMASVVRISQALERIGDVDPIRWSRVRRRLPRIVGLDSAFTGYGVYVPGLNHGVLTPRIVRNADPISVAMVIVHEATHAECWAAGIRVRSGRMMERVEALCLLEEIRHARRYGEAAGPSVEWGVARLRRHLADHQLGRYKKFLPPEPVEA